MPKLYIFDADGTLRKCTVPGQPCPNAPEQWRPIPWAFQRLRQIDWRVNHFAIASNQGGIAAGFLTRELARDMLNTLADVMVPRMPRLIAFCAHGHDAGCACRKPKPGMLLAIMQYHNVRAADTVFIGDRPEDEGAAKAAGVTFNWAWDFCNVDRDAWIAYVDGAAPSP